MKLPPHPRVEYKNNILFEVIFQARFPQIIRIATEQPVNFQEQIRKKGFPETKIKRAAGFPSYDVPENIRRFLEDANDNEHMFFSEDGAWQITLTKDFISLTCMNYRNYTEFEEHLQTMLRVFWEEYSPNYFNRIGLRYRNLANKKVLGIAQDTIREFVPSHIAPDLQGPIRDEVQVIEKAIQLKDEISTVVVRYIYGRLSGKFGNNNLNDEHAYVIDIDCFATEKIREVKHVIAASATFNQGNVRNAFQWSITDVLRKAMEPVSGKN